MSIPEILIVLAVVCVRRSAHLDSYGVAKVRWIFRVCVSEVGIADRQKLTLKRREAVLIFDEKTLQLVLEPAVLLERTEKLFIGAGTLLVTELAYRVRQVR